MKKKAATCPAGNGPVRFTAVFSGRMSNQGLCLMSFLGLVGSLSIVRLGSCIWVRMGWMLSRCGGGIGRVLILGCLCLMILRLRVGFLGRFGGRVFLMKLLALGGSCGG